MKNNREGHTQRESIRVTKSFQDRLTKYVQSVKKRKSRINKSSVMVESTEEFLTKEGF